MARCFLARAAARRAAAPPGLSPALIERLRHHRWPGNVRELANACAYAVLVAGGRDRIEIEHWPPGAVRDGFDIAPASHGLHAETRALEERRLREALARARWNKSQAARALGLSRQGLLKKLRRLGLEEPGAMAVAETPASVPGEPAGSGTLDAPRGAP